MSALADGFVTSSGMLRRPRRGGPVKTNDQLVATGTPPDSYTLTTSLPVTVTANALVTDTTNGLQLKVERCSGPAWTSCSAIAA